MKKNFYTNAFRSTMMPLVAFVFSVITISNIGCSKTSIEPRHIYDKNYFFTLNINNKSYTTYAWYYAPSPIVNDTPYIGISPLTWTDTGVSPWSLLIDVNAEPADLTTLDTRTCSAHISLGKTGDFLGAYSITTANDNLFYDVDGKTYAIDRSNAVFNIIYLSPPGTNIPVVEGSFDCTCYEINTNNSFHASGSFRLRVK